MGVSVWTIWTVHIHPSLGHQGHVLRFPLSFDRHPTICRLMRRRADRRRSGAWGGAPRFGAGPDWILREREHVIEKIQSYSNIQTWPGGSDFVDIWCKELQRIATDGDN